MREIITLQFGHFSNFIGTHYWNIQQQVINEYLPLINNPQISNFKAEIDNLNILYRESNPHNDDRSIYLPRLLMFDLKGSRGSLRKQGYQYEPYEPVLKNQQQFIENHKNILPWSQGIQLERTFMPQKQTKFTQYLLNHGHTDELIVNKEIEHEEEDELLDYTRKEIEEDLDKNVSVWSDYLHFDIHPKTICEPFQFQFNNDNYQVLNNINNYIAQEDEMILNDNTTVNNGFSMEDPFDIYSTGKEVFFGNNLSVDQYDEFTSQLMYFVEECDSLNGFQLFSDTFNAWGLTCNDMLQIIKDEVGSKYPLIVYGSSPFIPQFNSESDRLKFILNTCFSYADFYENASLFIPNSCQHLNNSLDLLPQFKSNLNLTHMYHSSSILASAFDNVSLAYRLNGTPGVKQLSLNQFLQEMVPMSSLRLSTISLALPFNVMKGQSMYQVLRDSLPIQQDNQFFSLCPQINRGVDSYSPYAHNLLIRGLSPVNTPLYHTMDIKEQEELRTKKYGGNLIEKTKHLIGFENHTDMLDSYLNLTKSFNGHALHVNQAFSIPYTFPKYLKETMFTKDGFKVGHENHAETVESCPVGTHLENSRNIVENLQTLTDYFDRATKNQQMNIHASSLSVNTDHHYNVSKDELRDYREVLGRMLDNYDES
ncbi:hypothetical protein ABK040_002111 [Willaertia magna]